ncbi:hypothetical protein [Noviherbaspirillum sp.]|uniref:hypothetical protein n=1 Tax=Noviherbaspirillum sp. TaxID=1926288 RepID=UPI002B461EB9|nr:hypothetical protein [Noviherbaspirillum sp.]HJV80157.1 hypothetical protein [Noviherbaspirillum sp.]
MAKNRCFSPGQIDSIVDETGLGVLSEEKSAILIDRLDEYTRTFLVEWRWQESPSSSDLEKLLGAIENNAKRLQNSLPKKNDASLLNREARRRLQSAAGGSTRLQAVVESVNELQTWAETARTRAQVGIVLQRRKDQARSQADDLAHIGDESQPHRHGGNAALNGYLAGLISVYEQIFKRQAGTTSSVDGEAGGPTIRFVSACLATLRANLAKGDLQCECALIQSLDLTNSALRSRIRAILKSHKGMAKSAQEKN